MEDDANMEVVKQKSHLDYQCVFDEFCEVNHDMKQLIQDDKYKDQAVGFEPKLNHIQEFMRQMEKWIKHAEDHTEQSKCYAVRQFKS